MTKLAWSPIARTAMVRMEHFLSDSWACTGLCRDALKPLPGRHERTCALHCASRSFRTETQPCHAGSLPSQKTWLADLLSGFSARNKLLEKYSSTLGIPSQRVYLLSVVRVKQDGGTCSPASQEAEVGKRLSSQVQDQPMQQSKTPSQIKKKDCQSELCALLVNNGTEINLQQ